MHIRRKKEKTLIVEVKLASLDNLRTVDAEENHKQDFLQNIINPRLNINTNYTICDDMG